MNEANYFFFAIDGVDQSKSMSLVHNRENQLIIMTLSVTLCNYVLFPSSSRLTYKYTCILYKEL